MIDDPSSSTTYVGSESGGSVAQQPVPVKAAVTAEIVDRASDDVLSTVELESSVKLAFKRLLSADVDSTFAKDMFLSKVERHASHPQLARRKMNISPVLTPEEVKIVTEYAPEFDFRFLARDNHDHGLAAVLRQIDTALLHSKLPMAARSRDGGPGVRDVGGDPMHYILNGIDNVHVCVPLYDDKDPMRMVTRDMRAARIADDEAYTPEARALARRFLLRDPTFVCGKLAQDCDVPCVASMSSHVYDIAMEDWPSVLQKSGSVTHQGCLLFPHEAYTKSVGFLGKTGAEYEVDVESGKLSMGFRGSSAWWYQHRWLDYMRHGVDQLIKSSGGLYSYHVCERRGDTVYFEILRVSENANIGPQYYELPGVSMVRVDGYDLGEGRERDPVTSKRTGLVSKPYWFPQALWEDMVMQAMIDFEKGVMTYDKLFNYYRTVSPRNTVNGVLVSGGHRVSMHETVPLVVHAGICGAMRSLLGQRTSKGVIQAEMQARVSRRRGALRVLLDSIVTALSRLNDVLMEPLMILVRKMVDLTDSALASSLVEWSVMPKVQQVDFSETVGVSSFRRCGATFEPGHMEATMVAVHVVSMPADHARAELRLDALRQQVKDSCEGKLTTPVGESVEPVVETLVQECDQAEELRRYAAIRECIEEHELEARQIADKSREIHLAVTDSVGQPVVAALSRRAEEYGQPDLWRVDGGLIVESALGSPAAEFRHSAVHSMMRGKAEILSVVEREYQLADGVVREVWEVGDSTLHGWVLTFDRLLIHNGPAILEALHAALEVPHRYELEVMRGAPGCGKTYTLLQEMGSEDVALCPARESALDTRSRGEAMYPHYTRPRWRYSSLDSYLCNFQRRRALRAETLRADEIYMSRAGYFYAAAGLLGCSKVKGYGDIKQIPPFTRVQMVAVHKQVTPQKVSNEYRVFRLCGDSLAAVADFYDYKCRTFNKIKRSMKVVSDWRTLEMPEGKVYALVMYQADKKEVRKLLKPLIEQGRVVVMSVHESQGKTLSNVWLFRMDSRPRSDNMCLFDRPEYCLVALTRHDKSFAYIRPRNLSDLVDKWVEKGSDPRRIAAAMDTSTLGQSIEML